MAHPMCASPAQPHNQFLGLVQGWISLGAGVVLNGSWMTFPAGNSAWLPEQWEHWGPGHAVGKSRQGPGSAVPGPPFPTKTTPIPLLKAVPPWLHTCPWQEGLPCGRVGVSGHTQRLGWV